MSERWLTVAAVTGARRVVADRGPLVVGAMFYLLVTGAVSAMWRVAAEANGGEVAGYDATATSR